MNYAAIAAFFVWATAAKTVNHAAAMKDVFILGATFSNAIKGRVPTMAKLSDAVLETVRDRDEEGLATGNPRTRRRPRTPSSGRSMSTPAGKIFSHPGHPCLPPADLRPVCYWPPDR